MRLVLLALVATLVVIVAWRWFLRTPPAVIAKHLRQVLLALGAVALLFLAGTGHLNWLLALLGALLAVAIRLLPLLRFAPLLQRLWRQIRRKVALAATPADRRSMPATCACGWSTVAGKSTARSWQALSRARDSAHWASRIS